MKISSSLHLKTVSLICLMIFFGPFGDVMLRKGMRGIGAISSWSLAHLFDIFSRVFTSGTIWLGIASLIAFFICYLLVLSWADYSFVQPASATGYAVVALLGYLVLGEIVTGMRWLGVMVICAGVFLVGQTPPRTTTMGD
jgi:drug/metabolite transporter (DMT)-like permease